MPTKAVMMQPVRKLIFRGARFEKSLAGETTFAAMFVAFGIAYSYGAFLEEMRAEFGADRATAAVFFSLTSLLYFGLGGLSGAAADRCRGRTPTRISRFPSRRSRPAC